MCTGGIDLKHLQRETESRLAHFPKVDAAATPQPRAGLLARLKAALETLRGKEERHV
jgi:hypothetical protein